MLLLRERIPGERSMKAETILAELNRLRKDIGEDPSDLEWLAVHHAFCFISYKMGDFQAYLSDQEGKGAFKEFQPD
jgi:hypothetical protein